MARKRKSGKFLESKVSKKSKPNDASESTADNNEEEPTTSVDAYDLSDVSKSWNLKISSWNINGLRAWIKKKDPPTLDYIKKEDPDIFCVQETKCSEADFPKGFKLKDYHRYWANSEIKGYSGVGLFSKIEPIKVTYGIGVAEHDKQGRVITAEYEKFFLVTSYTPNSGEGLTRLDYRQTWDKDFREYLKKLDETKPVVLCGDLNVAHKEIDLANPKTNTKTAGFTEEERANFSLLLEQGYIDTFRHFYPTKKNEYSFWSYRRNARDKNVGWRLDYFVVSERFMANVCHSTIRSKIRGSDHAPIILLLSL